MKNTLFCLQVLTGQGSSWETAVAKAMVVLLVELHEFLELDLVVTDSGFSVNATVMDTQPVGQHLTAACSCTRVAHTSQRSALPEANHERVVCGLCHVAAAGRKGVCNWQAKGGSVMGSEFGTGGAEGNLGASHTALHVAACRTEVSHGLHGSTVAVVCIHLYVLDISKAVEACDLSACDAVHGIVLRMSRLTLYSSALRVFWL